MDNCGYVKWIQQYMSEIKKVNVMWLKEIYWLRDLLRELSPLIIWIPKIYAPFPSFPNNFE